MQKKTLDNGAAEKKMQESGCRLINHLKFSLIDSPETEQDTSFKMKAVEIGGNVMLVPNNSVGGIVNLRPRAAHVYSCPDEIMSALEQLVEALQT